MICIEFAKLQIRLFLAAICKTARVCMYCSSNLLHFYCMHLIQTNTYALFIRPYTPHTLNIVCLMAKVCLEFQLSRLHLLLPKYASLSLSDQDLYTCVHYTNLVCLMNKTNDSQ